MANFKLFTSGVRAVIVIALILLFCSCALLGCKSPPLEEASKKELLIYCGTTMAPVVRELADLFEQRENCVVKIIKDGSGNLYRSIHINQVGDLYLPGSESYMEKCQAEGLIAETQPIGFNRAVLIVAKGNPLGINADLKNFVNGKYRTVLGAAESGSIGQETRLILDVEGIYRKAVEQALFLATDSKDIEVAIKEKRADLAMNWNAAALWGDNSVVVDVLCLDELTAPPHVLMLGLLKTSHYPVLARRFITLASSDEGQALLLRYGLGDK
ncbi:MAG: substrate-binding domain-containing protein [Desulfuromusa sp.]|nr:substrate-binding domain-containing protein [Desulfuromusa sp.]